LPPTSSTLPANLCVVGDGCLTIFVGNGCGIGQCQQNRCLQACDPTGTLGTPACSGSTTCQAVTGVLNPANNPYLGYCQ
jgi:hypothetical protein